MFTLLAFYIDGGECGFLKNFPLQRLHFISWSCSGLWLAFKRLALPSVLLVSVWDLAVSYQHTQVKFPPWFSREGRRGLGLLVLAFFLQTTQNAVVLTSGLSVMLASNNAVLFLSAAIRMHCETTGVWLKVVFSPMLGVVIVEGKSSWMIKAECWEEISAALSIRVCDWSQVPFAVLSVKCFLFFSGRGVGRALKPLVFSRCNLKSVARNKSQTSNSLEEI